MFAVASVSTSIFSGEVALLTYTLHFQMKKKRAAGNQLSRDNDEDDDEEVPVRFLLLLRFE